MDRVVSLIALIAVAGCDESVDIVGNIEVVGDAVRVSDTEGTVAGPRASIGMVGGEAMVSWFEMRGTHPTLMVQWFDERWSSLGEPEALGWGFGEPPRWVSDGESLWGQVWVDPTFAETPPNDYELVHIVRVRRGVPAEWHPVELELAVEPGFSSIGIGNPLLSDGWQRLLPGAVSDGSFRGALSAAPLRCGMASTGLNFDRLHLLAPDTVGTPILTAESGCEGALDQVASNPWLVTLPDDDLGILFRLGAANDGRVRFLRLGDAGEPLGEALLVGGELGPGVDGGWQPHGVAAGEGELLFAERRATTNRCHALRAMHADGTDAHDAPWQLACVRGDAVATATVELVVVSGGATLIYSEHTWTDNHPVTATTAYDQGIFAVLLTPEGKRASAAVRVTDLAATVLDDVTRTDDLGPYPRDFLFGATSQGDEIVVAWQDTRAAAPGIYARRLRISTE